MPVVVAHRSVLAPKTLTQALRMRRDAPAALPMAGCTDLYVALNFGTLDATQFLNLWPLDELRGIEERDGFLRLGALTTFADVIASPLVRKRLPILAAAAREVGGVQIQQRGTLGGNVANASPAGDSLPVLAAAQAIVELRNADGVRLVPFAEFYAGYRATVAAADELIVAFHVPPVAAPQWFRKVGTRGAQAISKVVMAGVGGDAPRVALGSVAPTVIRLPKTERMLASGRPIAEARAALLDEIAPIDDIRSTAAYRGYVAANLLDEFWRAVNPARRRR
jgi:CO/xanthine dehydrogenase FAD-binding subunit